MLRTAAIIILVFLTVGAEQLLAQTREDPGLVLREVRSQLITTTPPKPVRDAVAPEGDLNPVRWRCLERPTG